MIENKTTMNILLISSVDVSALHVGGGVAITFDILEKLLTEKGHRVTYLSSGNGGFQGCHIKVYNEYRHIKPCIKNFIKLRNEVKRASIVVCHSNMFCNIAALECYLQNKPFIYGVHTDANNIAKSATQSKLIRFSFDVLNYLSFKMMALFHAKIYVVSDDFKVQLKKELDVNSTVIDQSFKDKVFRDCYIDNTKLKDLRENTLQGDAKYILLYAGRIGIEKRLHLLIKAVPSHCTLLIIGDGPERGALNLLKNKNVVFINEMLPQKELAYYYHMADLFVSASHLETYGMSCHEALVCSTPVIVENAQGFRSQIDHGKNGYLVHFENTYETMKCIENELKNRQLTPYVKLKTNKENLVDFILNSQISYQRNIFLFILGYILKYITYIILYIFSKVF